MSLIKIKDTISPNLLKRARAVSNKWPLIPRPRGDGQAAEHSLADALLKAVGNLFGSAFRLARQPVQHVDRGDGISAYVDGYSGHDFRGLSKVLPGDDSHCRMQS